MSYIEFEQFLTPAQEHYLKKQLINLQLVKEFNKLSVTYNDVTGLRKFGPPFAPYDPNRPPLGYQESLLISMSYIDFYDQEFPLLRHFFNNFLITFPFISQYQDLSKNNNNEQFWVNKVQKFYEIWKSKKISNSNDRGKLSKRKLALFKIIKFLLMLYNSALPTELEEQYQLDSLSDGKNAYKKLNKVLPLDQMTISLDDVLNESHYINGIELNVVGVRRNKELKEMKSIVPLFHQLNFWNNSSNGHSNEWKYSKFYEFLIQIKLESTGEVYYIARRYTDFKSLHHILFKQYAGKDLPKLPSKVKQNTNLNYDEDTEYNHQNHNDDNDSDHLDYYDDDLADGDEDEISLSNNISLNIEHDFLLSMKNSLHLNNSTASHIKLPREKLRLALRGYLHQLLKVPAIRNSQTLKDFIDRDRFDSITAPAELNDIHIRRQLDVMIISQQLQFQQETIKSIKAMQETINQLKKSILSSSEGQDQFGLLPLFAELETKQSIEELSAPLKSFIDLSKIEIASTLYEVFLAKDQSVEFFKILKKLHQFFPYKIVALIMRFTNPMAIMKKLIDVFLIQPPSFSGNGKSLLQFIFTLTLNDDVKKLNKEVSLLRENIGKLDSRYLVYVDKIELYMDNKDDALVLKVKKIASKFNIDLVLAVLLNQDGIKVPELDLLESYRSFKQLEKFHENQDSIVTRDPADQLRYNLILSRASLFTYLDDFFKATLRKKDKDNLKELWDEPELTKLIKELITIFFQPLIKIFTEANVYLYVPILRNFINDLIHLINLYQNDYSMLLSGNSNVVTRFVELLTKYQNHLYTFIHNLYVRDKMNPNPNARIFTKLVDWFNSFILFLKFVRSDRPDLILNLNEMVKKLSLEGKIDHAKLLSELNKVIDDVEKKKKLYRDMINDLGLDANNSTATTKNSNDKSKLASNWSNIHQNLTSLINIGSDDIPISKAEMDELNMEFVDLEVANKTDYISKFNNLELLKIIFEFEAKYNLGLLSKEELDYNDEESDFDILQQDTEILKLLGDFIPLSLNVLKLSQADTTKH